MKVIRKLVKPTSPGTRSLVRFARSDVYKGKPLKSLTHSKVSSGGRNNNGHMTVRHRGGGVKRSFRNIDLRRSSGGLLQIIRIEHDPNRSGKIALTKSVGGVIKYISAIDGLKSGNWVNSLDCKRVSRDGMFRNGWIYKLCFLPVGIKICNVEIHPGGGASLARSAGCSCQIVAKLINGILIKLTSGESKVISGQCAATVGCVSNREHNLNKIGKAGRNRWLGRRPSVRGVAMNPVDHPHGGGEGKTSGGRHPVSPWGKLTKGKKTTKSNKLRLRNY
ncbi:MAG: 50S ribosomal protein L2 [Candidatus Hodgkinia cicadicola]